jgi:DNA-binding MarR family transcriptional regulator
MSSEKSQQSEPSLAACLRLANQSVQQKLAAWLSTSDYADIQLAHVAALQALWGRAEGQRLTEMAKTARITKQSMSALVEQLIASGYIKRTEDPADRRAFRLRLTERGRTFGVDTRAFAKNLEVSWIKKLGAQRVRALRETLTDILKDEETNA